MNNDNKRSRVRPRSDEDTGWLEEDDDYLDDGGLLGSLLFGDKKKKKNTKKDTVRRQTESEGDEYHHEGTERTRSSRTGDTQDTRPRNTRPQGSRPQGSRPQGSRPQGSRPQGSRPQGSRPQSARPAGSASVDALLQEVINGENDSRRRQEQRQEAWERTQRNVAKAKAEVERLEEERVKAAREESRRLRVQQEMERRESETEKRRELGEHILEEKLRKAEAEIPDTEENMSGDDGYDAIEQALRDIDAEDGFDEDDAAESVEEGLASVFDDEAETADAEALEPDMDDIEKLIAATEPDAAEDEEMEEPEPEESEPEKPEPEKAEPEETEPEEAGTEASDDDIETPDSDYGDMLNMDELDRMEKDIDEDRLHYSDADTSDLELGEIGRALGFEAVQLEDDEEEPEESGESDSEKFFREKLLDESVPKAAGPSKVRKPAGNKVWGIAFVVLLILFGIICAIYVKSYARMKYNEMDIHEISEDQLLSNEGVKDAVSGYRTIALYGVDSRESSTSAGTNSDCIIIASINESTKEIKLVSVYRDTLMEIAGDAEGTQKVNYAYQLDGALTAINTLNINLDLYVTDYVAVDFSAMASIIDAVGGVEVEINEDEIDTLNGYLAEQISLSGEYSSGITEAGTYTLDGQQAVAYTRIRTTDKGDVTRTERQRVVLVKIVDMLLSASAGELSSFLDVSFSCISTSLTKEEMQALVSDASQYSLSDTVGFPFSYAAVELEGKGSCLVAADMASNVSALHDYLYGTSGYTASADVGSISSAITQETGVTEQAAAIDDGEDGDGVGSDDNDSNDEFTTITEPPEGMTDVE